MTTQSVASVNTLVLAFLGFSYRADLDSLGLHPLDLLHKGLCGPKLDHVSDEWDNTMPSASELTDAGIKFEVSKTQFIHDINFKNGVLRLPVFNAHDDTEKHLLNLLAFEKLYPYTGHEVLAFMFFMDNLINTEKDVGLLRSKGVIKNLLSSDEELAQLVNSLGTGALMTPFSRLNVVQRMVSQHCRKPWNRWRATFAHTYLRNPWVFFSLLVAMILLVAAILSTVYTIIPFYHKN